MNNNRRNFLTQVLAAGIFTAACPHISLGRIIPVLKEEKNSITGIYRVKITDFPVLANMWGSVRMVIEGIPPEFNHPKMIVSHIDPEYWGAEFSAVSEWCPHEGYPIELLSEDFVPDPLFECKKGHGSLYQPTGTYYWGVSKKDLIKYDLTWDGGDNLYIVVPELTTSEIENSYPEISYLSECYPNPATDHTKILYGTEALSDIEISLFDLHGNNIKTLVRSVIPAGNYEMQVNTSGLTPGNYFIKMLIDSKVRIIRKLVIVK